MKNNIFNKTSLFSLLMGSLVLATSCSKELPVPEADPTPQAYVAVHNFTLLAGTSSGVFVNGNQLAIAGANVSLNVGASLLGSYVGVTPGAVTVGVRTTTGTANYATRTVTVEKTSFTSFFSFDTLTAGGTARMIALNNDMKPAASGTSNIRFLHLSPNAGPVNVNLVRTLDPFGLTATGNVSLANVPYIGANPTPNEATLSAFTNIPAGTYSVTVLSGTTSVLTATITLREGKNYSIVARGFAPGRPAIPAGQTLGATLLLHNP